MNTIKNIGSLIGLVAVAAAIGPIAAVAPASAAPQQSPGVTLSVVRNPANDAEYLLRVEGKLPMSEGAAYDRLRNLGPGGGIQYNLHADDPGDNDAIIASPAFIGAPGPAGGALIATPAGIAFMREFTLPKGTLNEDFCFSSGCDGDTDELYVGVRFLQQGVGELRANTNAVSGTF